MPDQPPVSRRKSSRARSIYALLTIGSIWATLSPQPVHAGTSLRFHGNGVNDIDRVKIAIDDPANANPGPPADVGATDFTIELWMKASAAENTAAAVACGANINWIYGNILLDRDRYNQDRKFGLSTAGGVLVFGVSGDASGDRTLCGVTDVLDAAWHHVAIERRRSDGRLWLFVDGALEGTVDGPDGDISYPDDGVPGDFCGGPCTNSDPYLVIGAEKHDAGAAFPSYSGWVDEIRISSVLRYAAAFTPPASPFSSDASSLALYHFDEGAGDVIGDVSGAPGGPSDGVRRFGGAPAGPEWSTDTPFVPTAVASAAGAAPLELLARPNPFRERTVITAWIASAAPGTTPAERTEAPRLLIVDPSGRVVARVGGAPRDGAIAFAWDARAADGARVAPGVYIARLSLESGTASRKIVVR